MLRPHIVAIFRVIVLRGTYYKAIKQMYKHKILKINCSYLALLDEVKITNKMHKFAPLSYSYILAPTCFGGSLSSSGSFYIHRSYAKIQIDMVVYRIMWLYFAADSAGKYNRLNHDTPTHKPLNHIM
jgi:hypothetical protein